MSQEAAQGKDARGALYGASAAPAPPSSGGVVNCQCTWVEVQAIDETAAPVPDLACEITTSDGRVHRATTDARGLVRLDNIPAGECQVTFPTLDRRTWERA